MSRMLWFAAGAGAGVYGMIRGRRAKEAVSAEGLKDRIGALAVGARMIRDEVAQGSAEAENDMRRRLGLVSTGTPELEGPTAPSTTESAATESAATDSPAAPHPLLGSTQRNESPHGHR